MKFPRHTGPALARWLATAAIVLVLASRPAAAETVPPAADRPVAQEPPRVETVLATESAARLGVARVNVSERRMNESTQVQDTTTRWLLIIGISAIAVALILALAD
jgi:hypothetical protein